MGGEAGTAVRTRVRIWTIPRLNSEPADLGGLLLCACVRSRRLLALALAALLCQASSLAQSGEIWLPLGPTAVLSQNYGLVTGRITALGLDPSDASGNTLYVGTTGGGLWKSENAAASSNVSFTPLTDNLTAMIGVGNASISIGALTVQPGGTGVILAGTGDPNDALDSYYGAGILRSADNGATWSLIQSTANSLYSFAGEAVSGFAWSTVNTKPAACGTNPVQNVVVAAVSQAYEGTLVNAGWPGLSYMGLYYSTDGGQNWCLAAITDGAGKDVQGPNDKFVDPDGNAATAVVWNAARQLFIAAVRYHGYYQSPDGITWTRMTNQPGANLMAGANLCSVGNGGTGSIGCPIFRGALAVNPSTGDTFAWTVDAYNQDQGIWQDICNASAGACASPTISFAQQWATAPASLETNTSLGSATIENGDYNLALAAVPWGQETMLLAGANDLWKTTCPYSQGCRWRNTTNSTVGFCAQVGEYQHALAWNLSNPQEIFVGNDSGLWRSNDAIGESGTTCSASDATHFQNLNGNLGSLAEVVSIPQVGSTPYSFMAGLGVNGSAGLNSASGAQSNWPQIFDGYVGVVAVDPNNASKWYVDNGSGVSIYLGAPPTGTTPAAFAAVLNATTAPNADVVKDGYTMSSPAPFLVDPLTSAQLLIGTCRLWRGPASGTGWSDANAVSPILDGNSANATCEGDALIRSIAALALPASAALPSGGEIVYVGMYGAADGGATIAGHVFSATYNAATNIWSSWSDLTLKPVTNDSKTLNYYGLDISSIFIDPHDTTGQTVYVTVEAFQTVQEDVQTIYGSTSGGEQWASLTANLPTAPVNGLAVDPLDSNTAYLATDQGVYSTRQLSNCAVAGSKCWTAFGSGLPQAPVVALSAAPATAAVHDLVAATYGLGLWIAPLWTAAEDTTTASASISSLSFGSQAYGSSSSAQSVSFTNTGSSALTPAGIAFSSAIANDFTQTNNCTGNTLQQGQSCTVEVSFFPQAVGSLTGHLIVYANVSGGELTVTLSGTGTSSGTVTLSPSSLNFNTAPNNTAGWIVGTTSTALQVTASFSGTPAFPFTASVSGPFALSSNQCGSSIPANGSCNLLLTFSPVQAGAATGTLTLTDANGTQTVSLSGTGDSGLTPNPTQLVFPVVLPGQSSAVETVTLTNTSGAAVSALTLTVSPPFSLVQNTCGATLIATGAGSSCSTGVVFSPSLNELYTGSLTVSSSSPSGGGSLPLSGVGGVPGSVLFEPNLLTFMETGVNRTSGTGSVTIANPDGVNTLGSLALSVSSGFQLVSTTCSTTLAPQASCSAVVDFAPTSAGAQTGSLVVSDAVLPTGSFIELTGMGFDFSLVPTGIASQTISNGQTAYFSIAITPLNGSQGLFAFQCGLLPPSSSCTFSPSTEAVAANTNGTVVVAIATGLTQSTARSSRPTAWPVLPLLCGLLLAPFALARRVRRRGILVCIALLAILPACASGCAEAASGLGTGTSTGNNGITPPATYTIPITATSNGVSHQVTLTLTVD